ncbi:hypothetical protein F8388_005165 [Cannabis sativa]|uniref:Uncharacterized protein n=1 Tax=Cannabis sativa TaxID=3483 RepID=A0A7J6ELA0_CANSA|nr:hypothetical protein F8388_005165 [Cannabis sativa]
MPPFSSSTCPLNNVVRGLPPTPTTTMSASRTLPSLSFTSVTCKRIKRFSVTLVESSYFRSEKPRHYKEKRKS